MDVAVKIEGLEEYADLEQTYVLEDALLRELTLDDDRVNVTAVFDVPIFVRHPEFGSLLRRLRRYFSSGVYLKTDVRRVMFEWAGCSVSHYRYDYDESDLACRVQVFDLLNEGERTMIIEADDVEVRFTFKTFHVSEI